MIKSIISKAVAVAAMSLGAIGAANAFVITAGDYKFTVDGYDLGNVGYGVVPGTRCLNDAAACDAVSPSPLANGVDTAGIFSVARITNITTGQDIFISGGAEGYLTGVFGGLRDQTVETLCGATGCSTTTWSVGGFVNLYRNATNWNPEYVLTNPGVDLLNGVYPGITDGSLYLSAVFAPGGATALSATSTYVSQFNASSFAGAGQGFLDITGGEEEAVNRFNTNKLVGANGGEHDMFLDITYNDINRAASSIGWTVIATGSVQGAAEVPEPGALALIAAGMLGAGAVARRRKNQN